jgi:hypothetical protein
MIAASEDGRTIIRFSLDESGKFRADRLVPGKYLVQFTRYTAGGWTMDSIEVGGVRQDRPIAVDGRPVNNVTIHLSNIQTALSGSVQAAVGGKVEPNAAVLVFPIAAQQWESYGLESPRVKSARVSRDGTFKIRGLPKGDYFAVAVLDEETLDWQARERLEQLSRLATRVAVAADTRVDLRVVALRNRK